MINFEEHKTKRGGTYYICHLAGYTCVWFGFAAIYKGYPHSFFEYTTQEAINFVVDKMLETGSGAVDSDCTLEDAPKFFRKYLFDKGYTFFGQMTAEEYKQTLVNRSFDVQSALDKYEKYLALRLSLGKRRKLLFKNDFLLALLSIPASTLRNIISLEEIGALAPISWRSVFDEEDE